VAATVVQTRLRAADRGSVPLGTAIVSVQGHAASDLACAYCADDFHDGAATLTPALFLSFHIDRAQPASGAGAPRGGLEASGQRGWWRRSPPLLHGLHPPTEIAVQLGSVVPVVGQGRVDLAQREVRVLELRDSRTERYRSKVPLPIVRLSRAAQSAGNRQLAT
jgi:hypothetical protein